MNFDEWITDVEGRVIGSGQCVGLAQDFSTRVALGGFLSTDTGPYPGYAGNMWTSEIKGFTKKAPTEIMMPGWLPIWGKSPFTPSTHVAVGMMDMGLGVLCMTQNPGAAKRQTIPKVGLLGYLAPQQGATANAGNIPGTIAGAVAGAVEGPAAILKSLGDIQDWVSDSGNWQRIGLYVLGFALLVFALVFMFKNQTINLVKGTTS